MLVAVLNVAVALEDPFDNVGLDGIYCDEHFYELEQVCAANAVDPCIRCADELTMRHAFWCPLTVHFMLAHVSQRNRQRDCARCACRTCSWTQTGSWLRARRASRTPTPARCRPVVTPSCRARVPGRRRGGGHRQAGVTSSSRSDTPPLSASTTCRCPPNHEIDAQTVLRQELHA